MSRAPVVAVTGANGFVGRHVAADLLARGLAVRALVRRPPAPGTLPPACTVHAHGDLCADTDFGAALDGADAVVHLAGRAHKLRDTDPDPEAAFERVNLDGALALARQAVRAGVPRLVFASTVKVLGEGRPEPYTHLDEPAPADAYARSKLRAERALADLAVETGLEVVIVRPPLVYGPGVGANFLRLLRAVDRGLPLPLGAVANRRSLMGVGNLADLLHAAALRPGAAGLTLLAGDGRDVSTPELVRLAAHALGRRARLVPVPPALLRLAGALTGKGPQVERLLDDLCVDIAHTRTALDWTPPFSMEEELARTAEHLRREAR